MKGGGEVSSMVFNGIILFLILSLVGALIYLYVYVFKNMSALYNSDLEIKSKIGSLVRDINFINKQDYQVEVEQQSNINKINQMLGVKA